MYIDYLKLNYHKSHKIRLEKLYVCKTDLDFFMNNILKLYYYCN